MTNLRHTDGFAIFNNIVDLHLEHVGHKCVHTETEYEIIKKWFELRRNKRKVYFSATLEIVRSRIKKK